MIRFSGNRSTIRSIFCAQSVWRDTYFYNFTWNASILKGRFVWTQARLCRKGRASTREWLRKIKKLTFKLEHTFPFVKKPPAIRKRRRTRISFKKTSIRPLRFSVRNGYKVNRLPFRKPAIIIHYYRKWRRMTFKASCSMIAFPYSCKTWIVIPVSSPNSNILLRSFSHSYSVAFSSNSA